MSSAPEPKSSHIMSYKADFPESFTKFFFGKLKVTKEAWPLVGFMGIWAIGCAAAIYWSLMKPDIGIKRSGQYTQYDWERYKQAFGRQWFLKGKSPMNEYMKRIPELDEVQEEMSKVK